MSSRLLRSIMSRYSEQLYKEYLKNPSSVHVSWQAFFEEMKQNPSQQEITQFESQVSNLSDVKLLNPNVTDTISSHQKVQLLNRAYQVTGHHIAQLDPLGIGSADLDNHVPQELLPEYYGLTDMEKEYTLGPGILSRFQPTRPKMKLKELLETLKSVYCGSIGIEYFHIPSRNKCDWLRSKLEIPSPIQFSVDQKKSILDRLTWASHFEQFVAQKYPSEKRFGLEGCEALIPGMKALIDKSVDLGVSHVVMGMPHRGRLNVLSNVVRKPFESLFNEFKGNFGEIEGSGDVKYHLGMSYDRPTPSGKHVHLSLIANPSHLEAVDPVVVGKTRALLDGGCEAMPILLHGDAAFAGQGVVYETFGLSALPHYSTKGTIHIVVNNQVGFTTDPRHSRSTPYCSDVAKTVNAPILHVNGDDVEAVVFCMELAAEWRHQFNTDVVVDIVCYRKYGHNEIDQPKYTQPLMYSKIAKMTPVLKKYEQQLISEKTVDESFVKDNSDRVFSILQESYEKAKSYVPQPKEWTSSVWKGYPSPQQMAKESVKQYPTAIQEDDFSDLFVLPKDFNCHPQLAKIMKQRTDSLTGKMDWSTAEHLAFASLLKEGNKVRLSGQDVERGTFSQRHAILIDQKTEKRYCPLDRYGQITVCNSSLSEFGVMGFELGYTFVDPDCLVIWEAQFGDFANNAQVIIDQFIMSGETKWMQNSGLVLNLPHGYDGQGPEHSSCRIERFLQLVNQSKGDRKYQDINVGVVYPSTPANYFHALKRQLKRDFRKPLILPFSKLLLRHPMAKSTMADLRGSFQPIYSGEEAQRVILCTGQVYYLLHKAAELNKVECNIVRVEELAPLPVDEIMAICDKKDVIWCQEEPLNMGAYSYVKERLPMSIKVSARPISTSVATGMKKIHVLEEQNLISKALFDEERPVKKVINGVPLFE